MAKAAVRLHKRQWRRVLAKPEWGLKRTCLSCGARFYDMQREPIVCPNCEAEFDPLALVRPRRARAAAAAASAPKPKPVPQVAEPAEEESDDIALDEDIDPALAIEDDSDDDVIADADDIDDDPDVSDVLENAKDDDDTDR